MTKAKRTVTPERRAFLQQLGSLGGQATVRSRGTKYMSEIGKVGFQSYADKYHDGRRALAAAALECKGKPRFAGPRGKVTSRIQFERY